MERWISYRPYLQISLLIAMGAAGPLVSEADTAAQLREVAKCNQKCESDARNKQAKVSVDGAAFGLNFLNFEITQCQISCTSSDQMIRENKSKQWDPNNPIVQKCFAESGISDFNIAITNHVTNNCIMNGIRDQRQSAQENVPLPTPRPNLEQESQASTCNQAALDQLETACVAEKDASVGACNENQIPQISSAPSQSNGMQAACQQTADYHSQVSNTLGQFISQCQSAKARCASACSRFAAEARAQGANCSSAITGSYHSMASAMSDLCNGVGSKLSTVQAQKDAADQAQANAQRDCQQHVAASSNPSQQGSSGNNQYDTSGGNLDTRVGSGPQHSGYNTSGGLSGTFGQYGDSNIVNSQIAKTGSGNDPSVSADKIDTSGKNPHSMEESSSDTAMQLAALPTRQDLQAQENADEGAIQNNKSLAKKTGEAEKSAGLGAASAAEAGSGGANRRVRWGSLPNAKKGSVGSEETEFSRKTASENGTPDLSQFLPKMGGMRGSSFDGHGPHTNLFEKISHRYKLLERTLLQDTP